MSLRQSQRGGQIPLLHTGGRHRGVQPLEIYQSGKKVRSSFQSVKENLAYAATNSVSVGCSEMPPRQWKEIAAELRSLVRHGRQKELAAKLGITEVTLSRYLNATRTPDPGIAAELASLLNRNLAALARGVDSAVGEEVGGYGEPGGKELSLEDGIEMIQALARRLAETYGRGEPDRVARWHHLAVEVMRETGKDADERSARGLADALRAIVAAGQTDMFIAGVRSQKGPAVANRVREALARVIHEDQLAPVRKR